MAVLVHSGLRIAAAPGLRERLPEPALAAEAARLVDPAAAEATLHWGRNYLYTATLRVPEAPIKVVVKQWKGANLLRRTLRAPSKAARAFHNAQGLLARDLLTPEPLLLVETADPRGASYYVCRHLAGATEVRYLLRALNDGDLAGKFPGLDGRELVRALGRLARSLHDRGVWFRDLTSGNVLLVGDPNAAQLYLVDTKRARLLPRVGTWRRVRDLSRMPLLRREHQADYLEGYCGEQPAAPLWRLLYRVHHRAFVWRNRGKRGARSLLRRAGDAVLPRRAPHVHIPPPKAGAPLRDRAVWDPLSHQPHQHAKKSQRLLVRALDAPHHLRALVAARRGLTRARPVYRELRRNLHARPVTFSGAGVAVRPLAGGDPRPVLDAVAELGVRQVLLRLHPWQPTHDDELRLAQALVGAGCELAFALPQTRELVTDLPRWRAAVAALGSDFAPLGAAFQVGQAPNRSRWGIWHPGEYGRLYDAAEGALRAVRDHLVLLGPAVIDFEIATTAALLEQAGAPMDGVASLLYVDRRGAPEQRQLGLDTTDKAALTLALARTSRRCSSGRSWITEFNWPLREGPHSPAGRDVAVSEDRQASYLVRYYLLTLGAGLAERVYWWQLIAKGYGIVDPEGMRRRPSFLALRTLWRQLGGHTVTGRCELTAPARGLSVATPDGELWVVWSRTERPVELALPRPARRIVGRDGEEQPRRGRRVLAAGAPCYVLLEE